MSPHAPDAAVGGHVVIAELELRPEREGEFVALARSFVAECQAREAGCRQFQAVRLASAPPRVLFFEVYDDAAAFEAHRASEHLRRFQAAFQGMVAGEQPLRLGRLEPVAS